MGEQKEETFIGVREYWVVGMSESVSSLLQENLEKARQLNLKFRRMGILSFGILKFYHNTPTTQPQFGQNR